MSIDEQSSKNYLSDPSLWFLFFSNVVTMFLALTQQWSVTSIMWVYWWQSVIIGVFNVVRMWQLQDFSTTGVKMDGQPVLPTRSTAHSAALFFMLHYGMFHAVYAIFLSVGMFVDNNVTAADTTPQMYVFPMVALFFVNHLFSYKYNKSRDTAQQNIGHLLFYPYIRILPMHLTLIAGSFVGGGLFFFLLLKTFADAAMHVVEHRVIMRGERDGGGVVG